MLFARINGLSNEEILSNAQQRALPYEQICLIETDSEQGTGTLIKQQDRILYILTAAHVIESKKGAIDAIFTLVSGEEIKCIGISAFIPEFAPKHPVSLSCNNDIAILKCILPEQYEFNVLPLAFCNSLDTPSGFKKHEAKMIGYGKYGINGIEAAKADKTRRLGETFCFEMSNNGEENGIISVLESSNRELGSFKAIPPWEEPSFAGPFFPTLFRETSCSYELVTDFNFGNTSGFQTSLLYRNFNVIQADSIFHDAKIICSEIHPRQARIMPGDSGGPLLVNFDKECKIMGVAANQKKSEQLGCFYYDTFTPVKYFSSWIQNIINGIIPSATKVETITPSIYLGVFSTPTVSFTLSSNARGQIGGAFGLHMFERHKELEELINYDHRSKILNLRDQYFELTKYQTPEEAKKQMLESNLFKDVEVGMKTWSVSDLSIKFIETFNTFLSKKYLYSESEFCNGISKFYDRYVELRERGLEDSQLPVNILDIILDYKCKNEGQKLTM